MPQYTIRETINPLWNPAIGRSPVFWEGEQLVRNICEWIQTEITNTDFASVIRIEICPFGFSDAGPFITFQHGKLVNYHEFSNLRDPAWAPLKEAAYLYESLKGAKGMIAEIPVNVPAEPSHSKIVKAVATVFGFASALKNYSGTSSFFDQYNVPKLATYIVSSFAALPSAFFNCESAVKVSRHFTVAVRKKCGPTVLPPELQKYQIEFESALTQKFPNLSQKAKTALWEYALKFILGFGYGAANFGLVLDAYPAIFNYEGIKEFLLASVFFTNFSIGYDKMDTITDNIRQLFSERADTPVAHADVELVSAALEQFEKMAEQVNKKTPENQEVNLAREGIKQQLAHMLSTHKIEPVLLKIETEIQTLQGQINPRDEDQVAQLAADADVEAQPLLYLDALDDPFYFRVLLPGEHPWAERGLAAISISVSALAVTSNIGGIGTLAILQTLGTPLAYILGVVGSLGAFSLNKGVTDAWAQQFLATFQSNVLTSTNKKQTLLSHYYPGYAYGGLEYFGLAWSAFASTSGVYYTGNEIEKMAGTSVGARVFQYAAQASSAITTTFTKAIPTAAILRSIPTVVKKALPTCLGGKKVAQPSINKELRDFYNRQISLLLEKIIGLIEVYKKEVNKLSVALQCRYGLDTFSYGKFIADLNAQISAEEIQREDVYHNLIKQYDVIRKNVMTAYGAYDISRDATMKVNAPGIGVLP